MKFQIIRKPRYRYICNECGGVIDKKPYMRSGRGIYCKSCAIEKIKKLLGIRGNSSIRRPLHPSF